VRQAAGPALATVNHYDVAWYKDPQVLSQELAEFALAQGPIGILTVFYVVPDIR